MDYLVYGAGAIGLTYAWLLSQKNRVDVLVRDPARPPFSGRVPIACKDLRKKARAYEPHWFTPHFVADATRRYHGVLVAVNRCQLPGILPALAALRRKTDWFAFMQNNWDLRADIGGAIPETQYLVAFPSSVGGGRDAAGVQVILFDEATRIGGACRAGIDCFARSLREAGVKTRVDPRIFDWLKVHYLQQSVTAGAVLECGDFLSFARRREAVRKLAAAFREGIAVCRMQGVDTWRTFPANLFRLPIGLVARGMQSMFLEAHTVEMVTNHMRQGLPEWIAGYYEVLEAGRALGLSMPVWSSYLEAVERYGDAP